MNQQPKQEGIKALQTLHMALTFGLLLICAVLYFISSDETASDELDGNWAEILILVLSIICLAVLKIINRKKLQHIVVLSNPEEKWTNYRALQIMKFALVEGVGLISINFYFLSQNVVFLLISLAFALYLFTMRPTKDKFFIEANIKTQDQNKYLNI